MEIATPSGQAIYSTPREEISKPCSSTINAVNRAARALVLWNTHCNNAAAARAALCVLVDALRRSYIWHPSCQLSLGPSNNSVSRIPAATVGRQVVHVHA